MKIFTSNLTREADNYTIVNEPISSVDLMERAARRATTKILDLYPNAKEFIIFVGPGNNGGDGLAIARLLANKGIEVTVYFVKFTDKVSNDFRINLDRLKKIKDASIFIIDADSEFPEIKSHIILIDAVFGSGLSRALKGFPKELVIKINELANEVVSVDIPSGLFGENNPIDASSVVKANHTLTFQYPSLSFLFPENEEYVGDFHIIDIGIHKEFIKKTDTDYFYLQKTDVKMKVRRKFSHKGTYGHVLIFAGSYGKAGASVLCTKAAHRSGAGLVTAAVPVCNYQILQSTSPETMLQIDNLKEYLSELPNIEKYNAVAVGPGIGFEEETIQLLKKLILSSKKPIVIDADALTILSQNRELLKDIPKNSILTPHPKEFERLVGKSKNNFERMQKQIEFSKTYNVIVLLKGAHTAVASPDGEICFNSTGNPGMATGGSGDVLTGIIASLLAQKYEPKDAAVFGAYIHGLAGDFAVKEIGKNALIASDIINYLPDALNDFIE